jgi:DMSO/TMAO reductase YedYZ molybdopterin-dependent catalytic subunit
MTKERQVGELYGDDPERADALVFGRRVGTTRRGFLSGAGLAGMTAAVGAAIPFAVSMPAGLIPAAMARAQEAGAPPVFSFPGKDEGLVLLGDEPLVAETPAHLLDDETTPTSKFFIRNNGHPPEPPADPDAWMIKVDGLVEAPLEVSLGELKQRFEPVTLHMVLECGGNGRSFFVPPARGNPWTNGGAGCAEWTGVRLRDVLGAAGVAPEAIYTAHYGTDTHLSGDQSKLPLSRGVRLEKAMDEHSLVVWAMNGEPLPAIHGGPVRLLFPGWPGSASHKWLSRIELRDVEHDGQGMTGTSYRVPIRPMVPGAEADEGNFRILESMPVRSIITAPANGATLPAGTRSLDLRGAAWDGDHGIRAVDVSLDFGASWQPASLAEPRNRYDWRRWTARVALPQDGYYEIWSRATDETGTMQPHIAGNWNPSGYGGNPMHRIALLIA